MRAVTSCLRQVNFLGVFSDACSDIRADLSSRPWQPAPPLSQVCQPRLSAISLYILRCTEIDINEPSLNFTLQLPLCGETVDINYLWGRCLELRVCMRGSRVQF